MIDVEIKTLRLHEPFRIAHGTSAERQVVRVRYGDGIGEAPFVPYYNDDPKETELWLKGISMKDGCSPRDFANAPRPARLALDLLWHDLAAKRTGVPLRELLHHQKDVRMAGCRSVGIPENLDEFGEKIRELSRSFRVLKIKLGSGDIAFDEAVASYASEAAPGVTLFADANGGWSVAEAAAIIPKLGRLEYAFVEQPVNHAEGLGAWRALRSALPTSSMLLFADESVQTAADIPALAGLADGVNVKLLKCGGLAAAVSMIEVARAHRLRVLLGCMIETSIGVTAAAHLAALADWIDLDGHFYVANDDYEGLHYDKRGRLVMPDRPGIGVQRREPVLVA